MALFLPIVLISFFIVSFQYFIRQVHFKRAGLHEIKKSPIEIKHFDLDVERFANKLFKGGETPDETQKNTTSFS